jgi:tight adherence protein C
MSGNISLHPWSAGALVCGACCVLLVGRMLRNHAYAPPVPESLGLVRRALWYPALLLSPLIAPLLSSSRHAVLARRLLAADFGPAIKPAQWLALNIVAVLLGAVLAAIAAAAVNVSFGMAVMLGAAAGWAMQGKGLRTLATERERQIFRTLPAYLDLLTVCVEAGSTLTAGIRLVVEQAPDGPLKRYFDLVLREVRSGRPRAEAFEHVAAVFNVENLTTLAQSLAHAESSGMSLGQVLRVQSTQRTAERFALAEKLALQAPVKLMGPLILCIFPCTFVVLGVPIVARLLGLVES